MQAPEFTSRFRAPGQPGVPAIPPPKFSDGQPPAVANCEDAHTVQASGLTVVQLAVDPPRHHSPIARHDDLPGIREGSAHAPAALYPRGANT